MTTAEKTVDKPVRVAARNEATLTSELVDAGSAVAERGVRVVRTAAETTLKVTDAVVLGTLGVAEEWATATPLAALTVPPVKAARDTWGSTRDGLRDLVAAV